MPKLVMERPFELVSLDCVNLESTGQGHNACLVAVDHFTKWAAVVPLKDKRASTITRAFECQVLPFLPRRPERVLTDNGPEFAAEVFSTMLEHHGIGLSHSSPNMPSCNGGVERLNRSLIQLLRLSDGSRPWDEHLADVVMTYNNSVHASIGATPAELILGVGYDLRGDLLRKVAVKEDWRPGHPKFASFSVGDRVMLRAVLKGHAVANKFGERFIGPHTVREVGPSGVSYVIVDDVDGKERKAHHRQLVKYFPPPDYLEEYVEEDQGQRQAEPLPEENLLYETTSGSESEEELLGSPGSSLSRGGPSKVETFDRTGGNSTTECQVTATGTKYLVERITNTREAHSSPLSGSSRRPVASESSFSPSDSVRLRSALEEISGILGRSSPGPNGTYTINTIPMIPLGGYEDWSLTLDPSESLLTICKKLVRANASTRVTFDPDVLWSSDSLGSGGPPGEPSREEGLENESRPVVRFTQSGLRDRYQICHSTPQLPEREDGVGAQPVNDGKDFVQRRYRLRSTGTVEDHPNVMPRAL